MRTPSLFLLTSLLAIASHAEKVAIDPSFTVPRAPFHIADNLYYVGSKDLAAYLFVTPQGDILINENLATSPPQIEKSIRQLGFRLTDIKILLTSHAHFDHVAGASEMKRLTGGTLAVMDADVPVVESGGAKDFAYAEMRFPPAKVDRILHDGDAVELGGTRLVAVRTPGHTPGCTTWTTTLKIDGKSHPAVIVGSWSINSEYHLVDRPGQPASYPGIARDYEHTFQVLRALPCDVFLGAHARYFQMDEKLARRRAGATDAVWIDSAGYQAALADKEQAFRQRLSKLN